MVLVFYFKSGCMHDTKTVIWLGLQCCGFLCQKKKENKIILRRSWQVTKKLPVLVVEKDVPKFNTLHTQPNQSTNPLRSMSMGQVA